MEQTPKRFTFDSIAAYTAAGVPTASTPQYNRDFLREYYARTTFSRDWFGPFGKDIHAAKAALTQGWPEGRTAASKLAAQLADQITPPVSVARRIVRQDQGDSLDIQDVYCGRLSTAWRVAKRQRRATGSREVWLAHYMGINGATSGNVLNWRGAAIAAAVDLLTLSGYNVGVLAFSEFKKAFQTNDPEWDMIQIEVTVKSPLDPLNPDALAGAVVNPAFLRVLYWDWISAQPEKLKFGLGEPRHYPMPENYLTGTEDVDNEDSAVRYLQILVNKVNAGL